jgi:hypothetical protein
MAVRRGVDSCTLASVFGSSHETLLPLSYVERGSVEKAFARALATQTHIAVFGTPGVGKSALVRHNLDWSQVIFVECLAGQRTPDVYRSMLSEAGARIKTETKLSSKRSLSGTLKVFSGSLERDTENTETEITVDLGNIGDVFRILRSRIKYDAFVVLNNFHVLTRSVQRRIVGNLQYTVEQTNTRFIIVGNWTSPAYLADLNSLLPSFVTDVNVVPWSDDELMLVLNEVARLMNVSFTADVATELIRKSAGSVRELTDKCRNLLSALGVAVTQQPARVVGEVETLRELSALAGSRLQQRYAAVLSEFLSARLYSAETVDQNRFLGMVAKDLIADDETPADAPGPLYSLTEIQLALQDAIASFNEPKQAEQARRARLIGELIAVIRQREGSGVSVTLRSMASGGTADAAEQYALRDSVKKLIRLQADQGFRPPLLAYDPHGGALIALEPKFRAFLRNESVSLESLLLDSLKPIDQYRRSRGTYWLYNKWHDPIAEAAATRRWLAQQPTAVPPAPE